VEMANDKSQRLGRIVTRREFLEGAAAIGLGAAASRVARNLVFPMDAEAASLRLTMFLWSGGEQGTVGRETVAEYLKTNKEVSIEFYESSNAVTYPKMVAAKQADLYKPLVNFGYFNVDVTYKGDRDSMWMPLNMQRMPNAKDIFPSYHRPGNMGIGHSMSPIGIAYNTQKVKNPPTSWADVWSNKQFKGRVILFDYLWPYTGVLMAARLNGGSEKNPEAGFEIWSKNTDQIFALVTGTEQAQNLMAKGDAWLTIWAKGNVQQWKDAGVPVEFVVPKEGVVAFPLFFQVVVGTTPAQKAVAESILNMLLEPSKLARWADLNGVVPTSSKVKLPPRLANDAAYQKETIEKAVQLDWATIAERNNDYKELWDRMVKAKL
jgi:putative spermidine/putrescine transport system substrate-binding protein